MKKRSLIFIIPAVLLVGVLGYALINALSIYIPQEKAQNSYRELKESVRIAATTGAENKETSGSSESTKNDETEKKDSDHTDSRESAQNFAFESLGNLNRDYVGWLTIDDTLIDYPVMKSSENDPEFYLHRDFYGNDSYSGCLFIGEGCNSDSKSFVIYGHNMNNESMFGALDEYYDYAYAEEHRDIRFYVDGEERIYRVFAAFQTKVYQEREDVFKYYESVGDLSQAEYESTVENVRALSVPKLPDAPKYPAQLMFLSTCSYHTDDGRFVVAAYRIK